MTLKKENIKIAIFASGRGSNAEKIIKHFNNNKYSSVDSIFCNNPNAKVLEIAKRYNLYSYCFSNDIFKNNFKLILKSLEKREIDFIILSGFLRKIPEYLCNSFENRIINIHPALLPKYGGKGMYGMNVHQAVKNSNDKETGITIHLVNENYDEGSTLFQAKCEIIESDTIETISTKVQELEHKYFAKVIEDYITNFKYEY